MAQVPLLNLTPLPLTPTFFLRSQNPHSVTFPKPPANPRPLLRALPISDADLLDALAGSSCDDSKTHLPAVRSYQNDLARLTLIGAVASDQALTAAAADDGAAAAEHLSAGAATMVIETVFPGSVDDHSTVSTRLLLPARKVKEKAKKMRSRLTADILSGSGAVSKNILAMTFRQVVLQRLWSFELSLFCPGTERIMGELADPKEPPVDFAVSSSDGRFLSALAEVVCSYAFDMTRKDILQSVDRTASHVFFGWFSKPQMIASVDSSVRLYRIPSCDVVKSAKKQVEKFNMVKEMHAFSKRELKHRWWPPPTYLRLEKDGDPGFVNWVNEHIPAYAIQINGNKFKDAKFEGWKKLADNRWEVFLTHFQMVELANILDMYYDDRYTLPEKELLCGTITEFSNISRNKNPWKLLLVFLAGGCFVVIISILSRLCFPHAMRAGKASKLITIFPSSATDCCQIQFLEVIELEALCVSIVEKIKEALIWPGHIIFDKSVGAWIGSLPTSLKNSNLNVSSCSEEREASTPPAFADSTASNVSPLGISSSESQTTLQDIASYQVVLSKDGKIVGFQPTNRVAINHWASNPLAKLLYKRPKLAPGILEPSLKIPRPQEIVLIELLMSVNPQSWFALARPLQ